MSLFKDWLAKEKKKVKKSSPEANVNNKTVACTFKINQVSLTPAGYFSLATVAGQPIDESPTDSYVWTRRVGPASLIPTAGYFLDHIFDVMILKARILKPVKREKERERERPFARSTVNIDDGSGYHLPILFFYFVALFSPLLSYGSYPPDAAF